MVGQAIKQVQRDIERDKATLSTIKPAQAGGAVGPAPGGCVYKPTPIASSSSSSSSKVKSGANGGKSGLYATRTIVPEYDPAKPKAHAAQYKPTPIKLLQKQKVTKPGMYVMDAGGKVDDNEYDPAVNFSTKGKAAAKRPSAVVDGNAKRPKIVVEEDAEDVAMFSEDDEEAEEDKNRLAELQQPGLIEPSEKAKGGITTENKRGVFTMDVNAILGPPVSKNKKTSKEPSKTPSRTEKDKSNQQKKSQLSKSHSDSKRKPSCSSSSHTSSAKDKSSHSNRESSQKSQSGSSRKNDSEKKEEEKKDHLTVPVQVKVEEEKEDNRNIFNLLMSETSNDSTSNGLIKVKSEDSNKENKKSNDLVSLKKTDKESSGSGSSSSRHRTHSSRDGQEKKQGGSSASSSHHKSDSHKRHHSPSHHRHRTSSGSSSSSTKPPSSSTSSSHKSSSHKSHHSSQSTSSSSKKPSSSHSSSSKDRHKSSSSKSHHPSSSIKVPRPSQSNSKSTPKDSLGSKPRSERTFSHVDLFGEDSDASDDVMIVEPPKVHIPIVELSSEEDSEGEGVWGKSSAEPPSWASQTPTKSEDSKPPSWASQTPTDTKPPSWASHTPSDTKPPSRAPNDEPGGNFFNFDPIDTPSSPSDLDPGEDIAMSSSESEEEVSAEQMAQLEKGLQEEDTYDECLRIFNEESSRAAQPVIQPKVG